MNTFIIVLILGCGGGVRSNGLNDPNRESRGPLHAVCYDITILLYVAVDKNGTI